MGSVNEFLYQKVVWLGGFLWVSVSNLFLALFPLVSRFFYSFRVEGGESSGENKSNCLAVALHEGSNVDDSALLKEEDEFEEGKPGCIEFEDTENDEEDAPKFFRKFKFQTYEEFSRSNKENWDVVPSTSTSKYEFKSEKYLSGFIEGPEDVSFTVKELYADSKNNSISNQEIVSVKNSGEEIVHEEEAGDSAVCACKEEVTALIEDSKTGLDEDKVKPSDEDGTGDVLFLSEKDLIASDSDSDSIASSNEFSSMSQFIGSTSDGFLSDKDFEEEFEFNVMRDINGEKVELDEEDLDLEKLYLQNFSNEGDDFEDEDSDIMEELEKLEESEAKNSSSQDLKMLSENEFHDSKGLKNPKNSLKESNKSSLQNSSAAMDSEDPNGLETLWEHQDLIEQLKMELKKVRAIGLPTILEESESPKIMEDLKPWKIDEKFQHEDTIGELHKFYRSYRERMRKFDILNYQKMYAIGFLQSGKDPLKSISSLNYSSNPGVASLLSQNFLTGKRKKSESDPVKKFIRELHSDLEVVYVGQLCLSWEILHWQYEKSLELWESDRYGARRYNEVAGEFQQFQVLMQRFIENEPFEGPRVQNYIKNRCVLRNLLQVPVIREDSKKDKKKPRTRRRDDYAITSDMLVEIMEESIRIFWRFVRADKDANVPIRRSPRSTQIEPQDSLDLELLAEVRASLQKKEKRLKDILRSGNCILRKFQKQQDNSDQVLYFFSQVDMKLVARVLNMSKVTTDQLLWCRNKLSKINFVSRKKIHVEPSFFLFPC